MKGLTSCLCNVNMGIRDRVSLPLCMLFLIPTLGCVTATPVSPEALQNIRTVAPISHVDDRIVDANESFVTIVNRLPLVGWDYGAALNELAFKILGENALPFEVIYNDEIGHMVFPETRDAKGCVISRDYSQLKEKGIDAVLVFAGPTPITSVHEYAANPESVLQYGFISYPLERTACFMNATIRLIDTSNNSIIASYEYCPTLGKKVKARKFDTLEKDGLKLLKEGLMAQSEHMIRLAIDRMELAQTHGT